VIDFQVIQENNFSVFNNQAINILGRLDICLYYWQYTVYISFPALSTIVCLFLVDGDWDEKI
jgi:hypothetical protein